MSNRDSKPCRNGCGVSIYWEETKWGPKPFEAQNEQRHRCPKYVPKDPTGEQVYRETFEQPRQITGSGNSMLMEVLQEVKDRLANLELRYHDTLKLIEDKEHANHINVASMPLEIGRISNDIQEIKRTQQGILDLLTNKYPEPDPKDYPRLPQSKLLDS